MKRRKEKKKGKDKLTARNPLIKAAKTGRMKAGQGSHGIKQGLMAHTTLFQGTIHVLLAQRNMKETRFFFFFFFSFSFVFVSEVGKQKKREREREREATNCGKRNP